MKKTILFILICCILSTTLANPREVLSKGREVKESFEGFVCNIFCIIWFIVGGVTALIIILSGLQYLGSENDLERDELKTKLMYAIVGLIIVLVAVPAANYLTSDMIAPFNCDCIPTPSTTTSTTSPTTSSTTSTSTP